MKLARSDIAVEGRGPERVRVCESSQAKRLGQGSRSSPSSSVEEEWVGIERERERERERKFPDPKLIMLIDNEVLLKKIQSRS